MLLFRRSCALAFIVAAITTSRAHAEIHALTINDWEPADTTSMWFTLQSHAVQRPKAAFAGLALQYLHRPVVVYDKNWKEVADLVARQTFASLGVGVHFADRFLFNISVPFLLATLGDSVVMGGAEYDAPSGSGVGDMRFELSASLLQLPASLLEVLVGARVWLPTGSRYQMTSDGGVRVAPQLAIAGRSELFEYSARAAYYHSFVSSDFADKAWDSRLQLAVALGFRLLDGRFVVGPEVFGSTALDEGLLEQVVTRGEVLLGCHYLLSEWLLGLGWGVGLTSGVGVPDIRALLTVGGNLYQAEATSAPNTGATSMVE